MGEYNYLNFLNWLNQMGIKYRQTQDGIIAATRDAVNGRGTNLRINTKTGEVYDQHILSNKYAWKVAQDPDTGAYYLQPANSMYRRNDFVPKNTHHFIETVKKESISTDINEIFDEVSKYNTTRGWKVEVLGLWSPEKIKAYDEQIKRYFKEHPGSMNGGTTRYAENPPPVEDTPTYTQNIYDAQGNLIKTMPIDTVNYTQEQMKQLNDTINIRQRREGIYTQKLGGRIATRYQLGGYLDYIAKYENGKPATKKKGWWAKEMETWSLAKKKEVLEKYGKEGLSEPTYKWLYYAVLNKKEAKSQPSSSNSSSQSASKSPSLKTPSSQPTFEEMLAAVGGEGYAPKDSKQLLAEAHQSIEQRPSTTEVVRPISTTASTKQLNLMAFDPSKATDEEKKLVQTLLKNLGLYTKSIDGIWGSGSSKALQAYQEKTRREQAIEAANDYSENKASWTNHLIDDAILLSYPFGYTDTQVVNQTKSALDKGEKQLSTTLNKGVSLFNDTFGTNIGKVQINIPNKDKLSETAGAVGKYFKGVTNNDEAAKLAYILADLDLSKPDQYKQAVEIHAKLRELEPTWGILKGNVNYAQEVIRGRIDLNLLHLGQRQKYNSYMINPDYTAKGEEVTYVYADPKKRQAERDFAKAVIARGNYRMSLNKKYRIYDASNGPYAQHGANYSIVTDADGSNPRYADVWDFGYGKLSSNLAGTRVSVGDIL